MMMMMMMMMMMYHKVILFSFKFEISTNHSSGSIQLLGGVLRREGFTIYNILILTK